MPHHRVHWPNRLAPRRTSRTRVEHLPHHLTRSLAPPEQALGADDLVPARHSCSGHELAPVREQRLTLAFAEPKCNDHSMRQSVWLKFATLSGCIASAILFGVAPAYAVECTPGLRYNSAQQIPAGHYSGLGGMIATPQGDSLNTSVDTGKDTVWISNDIDDSPGA